MARKKSTATVVGVAAVTAADNPMTMSETFESIKHVQGRTAAIQYLKDRGVTWKEVEHEGINWMRACMAASRASM